jgi:V/A-type H+-transporting ATPase subunit C
MDKIIRYSAVNTKLRAMCGKLLKDEDYKKMIALKTPSEIAVYMKNNTSYSELFKQRDPSLMHRDSIERLLKEGLINYIDKLMHYFRGDSREFFKCFYLKHEINEFKKLARSIHIDKDFNTLTTNLVFLGKYKYIDLDRIVKAKTIKELIQALDETVYYPYIKNLIDENEGESLYRFEMGLDKALFSIMEEKVKLLSKHDQEVFYKIYGSYLDMLNLQWIYRGKKYYNLTPEEIFNNAANKGCKFNYKDIKNLCYAKSLDEFVSKVRETTYGFMFKGDKDQDIFMERRMNRYMYYKVKKIKETMNFDISMMLCYIYLFEFETKDIVSIIENVRYGMDYEETKKYLIKAIN